MLVLYLFMATDVSEKYKSPKHQPLYHSGLAQSLESDRCFCTESSCWVIYPRANTPPSCPHSLNTFQVTIYQNCTVQCSLLHDTIFEAFRAVLVRTPVFWHMTPFRWSTNANASHDDVGSRIPQNGGYLYINPYSVISHTTVFKENLKYRLGKFWKNRSIFWGFVIKFLNTRCVIAQASVVGRANRYGLYGPGIDS